MRVLFCHDGPLIKDENKQHYGVAHNNETFSRYYSIADELVIAIRVKEISSKDASNKLSKITVNPFEVKSCPNISSLRGQFKNKKEVKKIISEEIKKSDYIVVRLPSFIGNLAVDVARKLNKPYLVEVVACPWDGFWNHSLTGKLVAPFMYYATKKRIAESQYVVYVTNEFLQKRYPTKGKNINCSNVALKEFDDKTLERRIDKIESMQKSYKIVIGTTAAVNVRYKGQRYVIQALGELKKHGLTNYEYQLVGGGDQAFLKSIAERYNVSDQIKFLGAMPHNKVFEWLETIDIYAQPSRQEGLPRALIEAMSRAVPAFGARTAGIPELLDNEFIFSNTRKNIDEICKILMCFDKETMLNQAKRNYEESKKYDKRIVEERRRKFFEKFRHESERK